MSAGFKGTYVMSWSQAELDGLRAPRLSALRIGATWSWTGQAVRVDGPTEVLRLEQADEDRNIRRRAARVVRRLVGAAMDPQTDLQDMIGDDPLMDGGFVVTDGRLSYTATLIGVEGSLPLIMFVDELPPSDREFWIVQHNNVAQALAPGEPVAGGVICFTPGTRIATPYGAVPVEELREGDRVLTKDNGPQEILWSGARRMSGARLYTMPHLRPVRISPGAFGIDRPDDTLLVSPEHRMLVRGRAAQALFNTDEVLVAARDLINGTTIRQKTGLKEITYIHLLLESHQVIWANCVETESFHPANAALSALTDADRARLVAGMPDLVADPMAYGRHARRNLTRSEAAILRHDAA
ncbi:Hint domain-containing protein [Pseudooceanicola onchidii]|uniref:Hint domain-containing protein n=1 Tax=Pseudooceanicola onchidii TaxID=2562279 RepID=UPI0010AA66CE|nr:Hint domain-containing protein [Pseudooceanicola onchidii]